ncbi:MAG: efflux RND transporter periplasmic adaptor subunit [Planctomycetes bacterium]|nr:efflux RND transporter periplasmic adaptor subunit [Planctomycetota bacterium]
MSTDASKDLLPARARTGGGLLGAALVMGLAAVGWFVYRKLVESRSAAEAPVRSAVAVVVEPVRRAAIRDLRTFPGTLQARSSFVVAPKIAGRLERLAVNVGDRLENGQTVAWLDDDEAIQQVEQARAELDVARAAVEAERSAAIRAGREHERVRSLGDRGVASVADRDEAWARLEAATAQLKLAEAQVQQRTAALKAAEVRLSYTQVAVSWHDGGGARVVAERFVDEGAMLAANTPILSVLEVEPLVAVVHVPERDYPRLSPGQDAVVVSDAHAGREFPARIARLAPFFRESSRQARIELEVPDPEAALKPGMFIRARVLLAQHEDAVVIPVDSVVRRDGKEGVFLADEAESCARFVPVRVGIVDGLRAEVLEPALAGRVVTLGQHLLENGTPLLVSEAGSGPGR